MEMTQHLSDSELLMAADGELPSGTAHLDRCWSCQERLRSIQSTLAQIQPEIPHGAGPRAQLRRRIAELESSRFHWRLVTPARIAVFCAIATIAVIFQTTVSADGPKPKPALTPGDTRPITLTEVCSRPNAEVITRNIPEATQRAVFTEYGIGASHDNFEVDYLITPDLGGSPSIRNLWPQPYSSRWNARTKDDLEQRLHQLVCSGKVSLPTAQHDIAADWIGAYKKYFHTDRPIM
jgi:hypothetical protein